MVLEVEYKYSLNNMDTEGRWNINKSIGIITINLPNIYNITIKFNKNKDNFVNEFISNLIEIELKERVCIERAYQKIRIKGGKCNPCVVDKICAFMLWSYEWDRLRGISNG